MFAQSRVYSKGAMVLHMLRWMVGDTVFKDILQAYAADPALAYDCAFTSDFKRVCETESGLDLDTFFAQWVETGTGYPQYTACSIWLPADGGYRVGVSLHQIQTAGISNVNVFEMPVEIVAHTTGGDVRVVVQNNQRDQNFYFIVPDQPPRWKSTRTSTSCARIPSRAGIALRRRVDRFRFDRHRERVSEPRVADVFGAVLVGQ